MKQYIRIFIGGIIIGFFLAATAESQPRNYASAFSLYSDVRAHRVGDIITIHIVEFSEGSNESTSQTNKESKLGLDGSGSGALKFIPLFGMEKSSSVNFFGSGNTKRSGNLRAKMTARITSIDENGNYVIEGVREVAVNNDRLIMSLTGLVRPEDIGPDNVILSYQIANAKISYKGKGHGDVSQKPGWITRIFRWLF